VRAGRWEIGAAFRGSVVRQDRIESAPTWLASVNSTYLSEHPDRETPMVRVEADIESRMELVLHDCELYRAVKGKTAARE
jgi:hypothetical protein